MSPIPEEVRRELWEEQYRRAGQQPGHRNGEAGPPPEGNPPAVAGQHPSPPLSKITLAERLKYVFLSERARVEAVVHQRQPGLIEALVKNAIHVKQVNPDLARTLFQLMVPIGFKAAARDTERLVLLVDGYTANLPWEMLQADDEPMVLKTAVVRQLVSTRFRSSVRSTTNKTACIIVDPSTEGFREHFGRPGGLPLPRLPGAVQEGTAVREILTTAKYEVELAPSDSAALDVIAKLFKHPYRILMIAAHGELEFCTRDGSPRSGVVPLRWRFAHRRRGGADGGSPRSGVPQLLPPRQGGCGARLQPARLQRGPGVDRDRSALRGGGGLEGERSGGAHVRGVVLQRLRRRRQSFRPRRALGTQGDLLRPRRLQYLGRLSGLW
ncbi:MAG: CHAT domain-containing protein [Pseudomonadota bacterium]|nr:CHAT domain-containing protein [Pseudomonadota bacterium]